MKHTYYYYKDFFTFEECKNISYLLKTSPAEGIDRPAENVTKTADVRSVSWPIAREFLGGLEDIAHYTNQQFFGLDVYKHARQDFVNYNVYEQSKKGSYDWHQDCVLNEIYDLKLTVIANISCQNFKGGEFELFLNGAIHIKELDMPGSVLIFPSYIVHRVNPVTNGKRETVSLWIHGPNFK